MSGAHRSAETFGELSRAAHAEATMDENFWNAGFQPAKMPAFPSTSQRPPRLRVRLFSKEFPMSGAHRSTELTPKPQGMKTVRSRHFSAVRRR